MKKILFRFYSALKSEDADPYAANGILAVADGLGGAGSAVLPVDRKRYPHLRAEILSSAFGEMSGDSLLRLSGYLARLTAPMEDDIPDTSALWASRIAIGRFIYALMGRSGYKPDLSDAETRAYISSFVYKGLRRTAEHFMLSRGKYSGQLLLPTTVACIRYDEQEDGVVAEAVWAGDSRCYALTAEGLKRLSEDDEDASGAITNLFHAEHDGAVLHYRRVRLPKPCALFVASDGVFDPYDPYDGPGVENTLLGAIAASSSEDALAERLTKYYDGVHADDASMAFAAFGFDDYAAMRTFFAPRAAETSGLWQLLCDKALLLEISRQTQEEATGYVRSRTRDKLPAIITALTPVALSERRDAALSERLRQIIEQAELENDEAENRRSAARKTEVRCMLVQTLSERRREFAKFINERAAVGSAKLRRALASVRKHRTGLAAIEERLAAADEARREGCALLAQTGGRIGALRGQMIACLREGSADIRELSKLAANKAALERAENSYLLGTEPESTADCAASDRKLIRKLFDCLRRSNGAKGGLERAYRRAQKEYENALERLMGLSDEREFPRVFRRAFWREVRTMFSDGPHDEGARVRKAAARAVGLADSCFDELAESIVACLAGHCDETSVADVCYNATRLKMFRAYFALRLRPDARLAELEERLALHEKQLFSLLTP